MLTTPANPYHHHHHTHRQIHEIPFWIGNEQRRVLVSGIKKMTTCQDVIRNLLPSFSQQDPTTTFFLVEKWRKIERKLEPNELILEVWKGWGDEKKEVNFILKESTQHPSSITTASPPASTNDGHHKPRRKHKKQSRKSSSFQDETLSKGVASLEGLLLLVLKQRETIQSQLKKLRHKEQRIEDYETKVHHLRRVQEGEEYVLDAYLQKATPISARDPAIFEHSGECSSKSLTSDASQRLDVHGITIGKDESHFLSKQLRGHPCPEECACDGTLRNSLTSLRLEAELILKILALNKKLKKEEDRLAKLGAKIGSMATSPTPLLPADNAGLEEVQIQLNAIREITDEQSGEIRKNEESLSELDLALQVKQERLAQLAHDLQSADVKSQVLQKQMEELARSKDSEKSPPHVLPSTSLESQSNAKLEFRLQKIFECQLKSSAGESSLRPESILVFHENENCSAEDNDSNSDTGISSLHSSRDDTSPLLPLDTLV